jgi:hypothetical protein
MGYFSCRADRSKPDKGWGRSSVFSAGSFIAGLVVGAAAVVVVPAALLTFANSDAHESNSSSGAFHATIEELVLGYRADPGAMNIKIGDRPIEVTGVLQLPGAVDNGGSLFLGNGRHIVFPVFQLAPEDLQRAARLQVGDRVSVLCDSVYLGEAEGPMGRGCRILSMSKRESIAGAPVDERN